MILAAERRLVAEYGRRLLRDGLVTGTWGNISVRAGDLMAITPSSVDYDLIAPDDVCVVGLDGRLVAGHPRPSRELPLHLRVYRERADGAIVHTHSPYATALSFAGTEIPGGAGARVAPHAAPGTHELAASVVATLGDRAAALLERHGAVTVGDSLPQAYERSLALEGVAAAYYRGTHERCA